MYEHAFVTHGMLGVCVWGCVWGCVGVCVCRYNFDVFSLDVILPYVCILYKGGTSFSGSCLLLYLLHLFVVVSCILCFVMMENKIL